MTEIDLAIFSLELGSRVVGELLSENQMRQRYSMRFVLNKAYLANPVPVTVSSIVSVRGLYGKDYTSPYGALVSVKDMTGKYEVIGYRAASYGYADEEWLLRRVNTNLPAIWIPKKECIIKRKAGAWTRKGTKS